jgi:hypothetical protein
MTACRSESGTCERMPTRTWYRAVSPFWDTVTTKCRSSGSPAASVVSAVIARSRVVVPAPEYHRWAGSHVARMSANVMTPGLPLRMCAGASLSLAAWPCGPAVPVSPTCCGAGFLLHCPEPGTRRVLPGLRRGFPSPSHWRRRPAVRRPRPAWLSSARTSGTPAGYRQAPTKRTALPAAICYGSPSPTHVPLIHPPQFAGHPIRGVTLPITAEISHTAPRSRGAGVGQRRLKLAPWS